MAGDPPRVGAEPGVGSRAAALVALIALIGTACMGAQVPPTPSPSEDSAQLLDTFASATTTTEAFEVVRLTAAEPQRLTPELARSVAAWMLGPLPGTETASVPPPHPSATLGVRLMLRFWDDHTPEQRNAFLALLDLPGGRPSGVAAVAGVAGVALDDLEQLALERQVREIADEIAALMSEPSIASRISVLVVDELRGSADAIPIRRDGIASGPLAECRVRIEEGNEGSELRALIVHEVMHCYQYALAPSVEAALDAPAWAAEGSATWAEAVAVAATSDYDARWSEYLTEERSLALRVYDALGFWAQLHAEPDVDLWSELGDFYREAIDAREAFDLALSIGGADFVTRWPAGRAMRSTIGSDWAFPAPGRTDTGSVIDLILPDGPRIQDSLTALHDQPRLRQIQAPDDSVSVLVEATTDRVVGRVGSVGGDLDLPLGEAEITRYCMGARCACVTFTPEESDITHVEGTDLYVAFVGNDPSAPGMLTLDLIDPYAPTIEAAICQVMAAGQTYVGPCVGADPVGPRMGFWCSLEMETGDSAASHALVEATDLTVSGEFGGTDVCVFLSLALIPESEQWRVDETADCIGLQPTPG